ncbi:MAG: hypothetical protein ACP5UM_10950 [Anaerolineae bacterium]
MDTGKVRHIQTRLERWTRKWWFFLLIVLVQFIPPYASRGYDPTRIGLVTAEILRNSLVENLAPVYPLFKVVPIVLVVLILLLRDRMRGLFSAYVALTYVLFAFLQNISVAEPLGLGIIWNNVIMFLLVAAFWVWEVFAKETSFAPQQRPWWRYWAVPVAFLAFWYPLNPGTGLPDFNPAYLFTNVAGLTFCMMTPVYLAVLTLCDPRVNLATLRVTGLVGTIIGLYNMLVNFGFDPGMLWWNGVLHFPLLTISIYGFALSFRRRSAEVR